MNNLDNFFKPSSVAVLGASTKKDSLSWELLNNLILYGYTGNIYPVNPNSKSIHSLKSYSSLAEIKDKIDLVIIMLPKQLVSSAIDECNRKKIKAVIVITAGFKESGSAGKLMEDEIKKKIKSYGIRLVGPNCMGIINSNPKIKLNGTFVIGTPAEGGIGFVSQSGALGATVLKTVKQNDIGLAQFISIGNKADVSGNTVLEYWENNDDVKVITAYLESFGNPRRFMDISRRITKKKPIIVIKSARTNAGMKAASSHTGALATNDVVVDAFLKQAGVIRVSTTEEMFEIAKAFDRTNLPSGNKTAILTNAGGPAILAVDECSSSGLCIPELSNKTQTKLKKITPEEGAIGNPVDLLPSANSEMYSKAAKIILEDENVDSLIVIIGPPLMLDTLEISKNVIEVIKQSPKCSAIVLMSQDDVIPKLSSEVYVHPPIYRFPETAVRAFGQMLRFKEWKSKASGSKARFRTNKKSVESILSKYSHQKDTYLEYEDVISILTAYGIQVVKSFYTEDISGLKLVSSKLEYPVVLKASGRNLIHKSDAGGVITGIEDAESLVKAGEKIFLNLKNINQSKLFEKFIIQPFVKSEIETILGISRDDSAGHLIMFGLGGIYVEVFKDVSFRMVPITDIEAEDMIKEIRSYKILKGIRGRKSVNIDFIRECLLRLSNLSSDFPQITEVDLNPFIFSENMKNSVAIDARIKVKF